MNFDNFMHYDFIHYALRPGFIVLSRFFWFCSFDIGRIHYIA